MSLDPYANALAVADSGSRPSVPYWYLWVDKDGVSHQAQCRLTNYVLSGVGAARWNNKQPTYPFGGRNRSRLFICAGRTLYAIYTNVRGAVRP